MTPFHQAAEDYYNQHRWTCMPLKLDPQGYPKRPIVTDWTNIRQHMPTIDARPWEGAAGLGILLGPASSNLAVIDIDSKTLARAVYDIIKTHDQEVYAVRTARGNMHLYLTEIKPSPSSKFPITWEGERLYIEHKGTGTQVAAPPSPGYSIVRDTLLEWESMATLWRLISARLQYLHPDRYEPTVTRADGTPAEGVRPWLDEVTDGNRNNTLFVEAHKLREAGMPFEQALPLLITRTRLAYEANHDMTDHEVEQTVASAYRKGVVTRIGATTGPRELNPL